MINDARVHPALRSKLADNLNAFNAALLNGATMEDAVLSTFTGSMAKSIGYSNVSVDMAERLMNADGVTFSKVVVYFNFIK